jgi:hypothetical protein
MTTESLVSQQNVVSSTCTNGKVVMSDQETLVRATHAAELLDLSFTPERRLEFKMIASREINLEMSECKPSPRNDHCFHTT